MLFTFFIAVLAATLCALGAFLADARGHHDPTSLELTLMATVTIGTYAWMKRLRTIRAEATAVSAQATWDAAPTIADRYYAAQVDRAGEAAAAHDAAATPVEHVA